MKDNFENINIDEIINLNLDKDLLKKRKNGLILRDSWIEILKKYNINYEEHTSLSSLIFEIEEILNYETDLEDLEKLSEELQEINYYNYTNK